jgi:hypothetical protein
MKQHLIKTIWCLFAILIQMVAPMPTKAATSVNSDYTGQQWNLDQTGTRRAWEITRGDGNIVVAVIDTGVDYNHVDLQANIWSNIDEVAGDGIDNDNNGYVDDIRGWDFVDYDNTPLPSGDGGADHGTAVAGVIGATQKNGGVDGISNVKLMPIRVRKGKGIGLSLGCALNGDGSKLSDGIRYAVKNKANLINLSLNANRLSDWGGCVDNAIAYATDENVLIVAAVGNNNQDSIEYPSNLFSVLAVGASDRDDKRWKRFLYGSNYGQGLDVMAPGSSDDIPTTTPNNNYGWFGETSAAAPQVVGLASLIWSVNPDLTASQVIKYIEDNADKVGGYEYTNGWNNEMGFGRINAFASVYAVPLVVPTLQSPQLGSTVSTRPAFDWKDSPTASGYDLQLSQSPGFSNITYQTSSQNSFFVMPVDLVAGQTYYWRVSARRAMKTSLWSTPQSITISSTGLVTSPPVTQPPPVSSANGIELTSVSRHILSPGQSFNPSVTVRVLSGQLLQSRGDHLHAVPDDSSNVLGAYPVQPVKATVGANGSYTFDTNNDAGFRMIAPSTPGTYYSTWQLRVGGQYIGPRAVIEVVVQAQPQLPEGVTFYKNDGQNPNDGGTCRLTQEVPSITQYCGNGWNDEIESITISGPYEIVMYQDDWYGGGHRRWGGSGSLPAEWKNRMSSVRIRRSSPAAITLYSEGDFNAMSWSSDRDVADLGHWDEWNDFAKSARVAAGYGAIFCSDAGYKATCRRVMGPDEARDLNGWAFGLRSGVSSIRVCAGGCPDAGAPPVLSYPFQNQRLFSTQPITLSWQGTADEYFVEVWGGALATTQRSNWTKNTQWPIGNLPVSSAPYFWHAKAWRGYGETNWAEGSFYVITPDTNPPSVQFNWPNANALVNSYDIDVSVNSTDDQSGVSRAQFFAGYYDGGNWNWRYFADDTNPSDGLTARWNAASVSDQYISFWAFVWDQAGNLAYTSVNDVVLDLTNPTSKVNALPPNSAPTFDVSWVGGDNLSGIQSWDVQYQVDGGVWTDWHVQTNIFAASFTGETGHTYAFRVRARDKAGNIEGWPDEPDAQTTIQAGVTGGTRYVSTSGSDGANTCTNVASPCRTIQHAVTVAQAGDEVRVAQGTYTGQMETDIWPATVLINKDIALLGGYNANFTQRNAAINITTIDGQQKPGSVIIVLGPSARVDGFTIINGRAQQGAGVWVGNWETTMPFVTLSNNVIENNHTVETADNWGNGAGVFVVGNVSVLIQSNRISGNVIEDADGNGAGIAVHWGATAVISGNQVLNNSTTQNTVGGIQVYSATVTIVNNLVQGNRNVGVDAYDTPSVMIQGNTIVSNSTSYDGGGIRIGGQTAYTITQNLISGNSADGYYGGGIHVSDGPSGLIERNVIQNNRAAGSGGGVAICGTGGQTVFTITQNTITGNSADATDGGGIFVGDGPRGLIERNVIQNNRAATSGGGVAIYGAGGRIALWNNDIIANTSGWGGGIAVVRSAAAVEMSSNNVLRNRTTEGDYQSGVLFSDVTAPVTLINNVIAGNNNRGIKAVNTPDVQFINNTIVSNGAIGVEVLGWPEAPVNPLNAVLTNNIIAGHTECGITGFNNAAISATTNVLWNTAPGGSEICSEIIRSTGVFASDPKFVNAASGDYHLQSGSPAVNAGTNAGAPPTDKDGTPRPQAGRVDIGAYEIAGWRIYAPIVVRKK